MTALIAFEVGDVRMKSPTFEKVMRALLERSTDPVDQEVCTDALVGNSLWADQIPEQRKGVVLAGLWSVLDEQLRSGVYDDNMTAVFQIRQLRAELVRRYRGLLTQQLPELVEFLRLSESATRLRDAVLRLLDESPIARDEVRADVREAVVEGETALAFEVMCEEIVEAQVGIGPDYFQRMAEVAEAMDVVESVIDLLALAGQR